MDMSMRGYHGLNEQDLKQYAFCRGGADLFYKERHKIGIHYYVYCHVLGNLTLQMERMPSASFRSHNEREMFRRQLGQMGLRAVQDDGDRIDNLSRADSRAVVDLAVAAFSDKGRARDMVFNERGMTVQPIRRELERMREDYPHEYDKFLFGVRQRVRVPRR